MLRWAAAATSVAVGRRGAKHERTGRVGAGRATRPLAGGGGCVRGDAGVDRPRRRGRSTTRSPATRCTIYAERQRPAAGRLRRQPDRRVLPGDAGACERRVEHRGHHHGERGQCTDFALHGFLGLPFNRTRSGRPLSGDGSAGTRGSSPPTSRPSSPGSDPNVTIEQTPHVRQRLHGRRRPVQGARRRRQPHGAPLRYTRRRPLRRGRRRRRRLPRSRPPRQVGGSQRGGGELGDASSRSPRCGPLPGVAASTASSMSMAAQPDRPGLQRHDQSARFVITAWRAVGHPQPRR